MKFKRLAFAVRCCAAGFGTAEACRSSESGGKNRSVARRTTGGLSAKQASNFSTTTQAHQHGGGSTAFAAYSRAAGFGSAEACRSSEAAGKNTFTKKC